MARTTDGRPVYRGEVRESVMILRGEEDERGRDERVQFESRRVREERKEDQPILDVIRWKSSQPEEVGSQATSKERLSW